MNRTRIGKDEFGSGSCLVASFDKKHLHNIMVDYGTKSCNAVVGVSAASYSEVLGSNISKSCHSFPLSLQKVARIITP